MSQQPPPPPYGAPPGPPGSYPPGGSAESPRSGMSNKARFWIGALLALPAMFVGGLVIGGISALAEAVTGSSSAGSAASVLVGVVLLAAYVASVVWTKTRWFAIGALAGGAVLLILAAGACVLLIVVVFSGYN